MIIIESEAERETLEQLVERQQTAGLEVSLLDAAQARELEPALSTAKRSRTKTRRRQE
jgi:L-2-hydroxyglutarate oxidase LhgO